MVGPVTSSDTSRRPHAHKLARCPGQARGFRAPVGDTCSPVRDGEQLIICTNGQRPSLWPQVSKPRPHRRHLHTQERYPELGHPSLLGRAGSRPAPSPGWTPFTPRLQTFLKSWSRAQGTQHSTHRMGGNRRNPLRTVSQH